MVSRILPFVGWIAVALTALQFFPQVLKAYKSKKLGDISLITYVIVVSSSSMWIIHGVYKSDTVIITANVFVLACALSILVMKQIYK